MAMGHQVHLAGIAAGVLHLPSFRISNMWEQNKRLVHFNFSTNGQSLHKLDTAALNSGVALYYRSVGTRNRFGMP